MLYLILIPAGIIIGHIGIVAKILPKIVVLHKAAWWLARLWCISVLICWLVRVRQVGHIIVQGPYDTALSLALTTMVVAIVWEHWARQKVLLSPLAALVSAAIMGRARSFGPVDDLVSFDHGWLVVIHASLAYFAFAVLALNSFFALRIILGRGEHSPELVRWFGFSLRLGFFSHSLMVFSGVVTSVASRSAIWNFDPIESLALCVWLIYGTVLLVHRSGRWSDRSIAGICFVIFFIVVLSFRLVDYLPPDKSFHWFPGVTLLR